MNIAETFRQLSIDHLHHYVASKQEEHLHLDFKLVNDSSLAHADDKRNLARVLSGFANSSGGLIIWGVDARRNEDGIDCASALREIDRIAFFLTRLNQLTGDSVDPTVQGVLHRIIHQTIDGKGYAASLVPESDSGPHMAKLGEDRYYKRSGDSFYKMEHYDIADMFARRRKPKLVVTVRIESSGTGVSIVLGLRNEGRATARAPYLAIRCNGDFRRSEYGLDGNRYEGMPLLRSVMPGYSWCYGGGADVSVHPGMSYDIARLDRGTLPKTPPSQGVSIHCAVACDDQSLCESQNDVSLSQLLEGRPVS